MDYILEAVNITKTFPGVLANKDVCLNLKKGEILGLIGENGAGKSTLLKMFNGIYPYGTYSGKIIVEEKEMRAESPADALKSGIGYVPQEINVLKNFCVAENVYAPDLHLRKWEGKEGHNHNNRELFVNFKKLYKATEQLFRENSINLDPRADVRKLSVGQWQLLMIARALAARPKALILDEPTTSLSSRDVGHLFEVILELKKKGMGIIFVTHKLAEIMELTDRVTILRDGRNISTFERKDYNEDRIITDMIGREIKNMYPSRESNIGEEVLRVENLTIEHPYIANKNLIENVSFNVRAGEVLGLAGLVGAGRSEVCMGLYGLIPVKNGKIFMRGREVTIRKTGSAMKQKIGMISEDRKRYGLNFVWDIKHNIAISNLKSIQRGIFVLPGLMTKMATPFFERLKIKAPSLKTMVLNLSGGNQQKVVIARSLNTNPELIILDEPTKGIDVGSKNEIYHLINEMAAQKKAIVLITSELPELLSMSDRFIVMAEGRVVDELSKEDASEKTIMERAVKTAKTAGLENKGTVI